MYGYRAGGLDANGQPNTASAAFQARLTINGRGRHQSSSLDVMTSSITSTDAGFVQTGGTTEVSRRRAWRPARFASGTVASTAPIPTDGAGVPTDSYTLAFEPAGHHWPFAGEAGSWGGGSQETVTPSTAPPPGLGTDHPAETLNGYVGGLAQTVTTSREGTHVGPAYIVTNVNNSPGDVSITLYDSSRLSAQLNVKGQGKYGSLGVARLRFGARPDTGTTAYDPSRAAYVDFDYFAARAEVATRGSGHARGTSTVDGRHVPDGDIGLALVTNKAADVATLFPHVNFCACDYTQWGVWAASVEQPYGHDTVTNKTGIAFWVAGSVPASADAETALRNAASNNVTATYDGHVIADIANGESQYIAAGNFSNSVDFARRTGWVTTTLDGSTYRGRVNFGKAVPSFAQIQGTLSSGHGDFSRTMQINGTFFQGGADPLAEMGGSVAINGRNYLGSGIFAAAKRP
jgi:hypothetical protein